MICIISAECVELQLLRTFQKMTLKYSPKTATHKRTLVNCCNYGNLLTMAYAHRVNHIVTKINNTTIFKSLRFIIGTEISILAAIKNA